MIAALLTAASIYHGACVDWLGSRTPPPKSVAELQEQQMSYERRLRACIKARECREAIDSFAALLDDLQPGERKFMIDRCIAGPGEPA